MPVSAHGSPDGDGRDVRIRVAAAGDIHCGEPNREEIARAFSEVDGAVDLILLAGDLTTHGDPDEGRVLADACRGLRTPVVTVLGNHDWHVNRRDALVAALQDGGIEVLDPGWTVHNLNRCELGVVGAKGFVGGFPGSHLPDFGEPSLRAVYAEAGRDVDALDEGLRAIALCQFRIVVLHYAPIAATLEGEPPEIWTLLGTDRLAAPIVEHTPDLVVHGHAHTGTFEGEIAGVPVYNVSVPVIGRDFWIFELTGAPRPSSTIH
jgi:Icc-related predicted phosphoesterase